MSVFFKINALEELSLTIFRKNVTTAISKDATFVAILILVQVAMRKSLCLIVRVVCVLI